MSQQEIRNRITRREMLYLGAGLAVASAGPPLLLNREVRGASINRFQRRLPIPPTLAPLRTDDTGDYYEITQRESEIELLPGLRTRIWGYEGMLPGPTIQAQRGRPVVVRHTNQLTFPTVVHLHGGVTPSDSDGFPTDMILPGQSRTYVPK